MANGGGQVDPTKLLDDEPGQIPAGTMAADDQIGAPRQEDIAELAYSYWEARGGHGGSPWDDWFRAERELRRKEEI
jgi:hypothetical protein